MKSPLILFFLLFFNFSNAQVASSEKFETKYFEFHNNFWLNLHHFLYQQAKGDQVKHLKIDNLALKDIGDKKTIASLTDNDKYLFEKAINYYKETLIDQSLLYDLADMRLVLQKQKDNATIEDDFFKKEHLAILNDFKNVYEKHFWANHKKQNKEIIQLHLNNIIRFEESIVPRLSHLAIDQWPNSKVRVDLCTYANWAGAYTQTGPSFNIVISTLDPLSESTAFVETVFHEGAHILYSRDSGFRSQIYFKSKALKIEFPKNLWHASLFYLCGKIVQQEYKALNIKHELLMIDKDIFSEFMTKQFTNTLDQYLEAKLSSDETINKLLAK